ncbi:hypothetical protein AK812_SmicGene30057 [Symbiodinium microadriaticum]|uniref:Uncharacterized protein n=1 Tax=Symbiodinium microadriaticum TaxID=2951 RepID=A0A1Q9D085_SYMMI|nr:hypothetical protein AK812_SmicGene30057 [Symbiodinium microadriaticum]
MANSVPSARQLNFQAQCRRSNFKSLVEAATGIPIPHQKLFYGPGLLVLKDRPASEDVSGKSKSGRGDSVSDGKSTLATSVTARPAGVLEDNSKALYQFEIGQGSLLHLSIRSRDPRKVADYEEELDLTEGGREVIDVDYGFCGTLVGGEAEAEGPICQLPQGLFPRIRAFMNTKVGPKMGKECLWLLHATSYRPLQNLARHDNGIFDFAGRIRKKCGFHRLPRLANAAASAKLVEAHEMGELGEVRRSSFVSIAQMPPMQPVQVAQAVVQAAPQAVQGVHAAQTKVVQMLQAQAQAAQEAHKAQEAQEAQGQGAQAVQGAQGLEG